MPRAVKTKTGALAAVVPKKGSAPKRNKLYAMPEKISEGTILTDLSKAQWSIGSSIGTGGFGEIYSACRVGEKNYNYVVKCEPHGNGPLFVEMHFYMRNAKLEDIKRFQREHGLKSLGMPYMIGNGSVELKGIKHRFIVMPRYGSDISKFFLTNGRRIPEGTIYRLAIQMLDVYEFIHSCGYVHADLKAANILLGYGKDGNNQAYLVDYGLASHYTTKDFKPDPKKMHNGTIEYTSRDAHQGVPTMRADFEILGYNIIEWSGSQLPWVKNNILTVPTKVQKAKEEFMADVPNSLKTLYAKSVPGPIIEYMKYVAKLEYNETPDYENCRKIFSSALKDMKIPNSGELLFATKNKESPAPSTSRARPKLVERRSAANDTSVELCASDDDDDDVIFEEKEVVKKAPQRTLKTITKRSPKTAVSPKRAIVRGSPDVKISSKSTPKITPLRKRRSTSFSPSKAPRSSPLAKKSKPTPREAVNGKRSTPNTSASYTTLSTPVAATANINFSPAISLSTARPGKTIVNDNTTPVPRAGKTYEFNFELDVSMDANVVVNVKRKKKATANSTKGVDSTGQSSSKSSRATAQSTKRDQTPGNDKNTPVTRVKVRKLPSDDACDSPRTPAVTVKKSKRIVS